jgi:aromatic-amino-acid transaminase
MQASIEALANHSIVLLHACCHNPTGVDLNTEQWEQILSVICSKELIPFFDFAYQGLAEGLEEDALPIRLFADAGVSFLVASSFSKNFSLYRRRTGALTLVTSNAEEAQRVMSQVKRDIRVNYSSPPYDGGALAAAVLSDHRLRSQWEAEVAAMRERIKKMRRCFVEALEKHGAKGRFNHILSQKGMFSYSGLTAEQVDKLKRDWSVYAVGDGRICLAAMSTSNIDYIAKAVASVSAD